MEINSTQVKTQNLWRGLKKTESLLSITKRTWGGSDCVWSLGDFWTGHETLRRISSDRSHEPGSAASHAAHMNPLSCFLTSWAPLRLQADTLQSASLSGRSGGDEPSRFFFYMFWRWFVSEVCLGVSLFNIQNVTEWIMSANRKKMDKTAKKFKLMFWVLKIFINISLFLFESFIISVWSQ